MPDSRPAVAELLAVVQQPLAQQVAPLLPAYQQFQLKIVDRMLATVGREISQGPAADRRELERLGALLGRAGTLDELNAALARAIRDGGLPIDDARLLAHLRASTEDALRINNPNWIADAR